MLGVALWLVPAAGFAQNAPLASILPELLGNTITLLPSSLPIDRIASPIWSQTRIRDFIV